MHNGSLKFAGNRDQLCVGSGATRSAEDGNLFRAIQKFGKNIKFFIRWANGGLRFVETYARPLDDRIFQSYVSGQHNHRDATLRDCGLNGDFQDTRHLFGIGDKLAIMAALRKEMFGVSLLKVSAPNLPTRNMCGNGEYWNTVALTIVEAVDQMHVPRSTAPGAHRQFPREMGFRSCSKRCDLFMSDVY